MTRIAQLTSDLSADLSSELGSDFEGLHDFQLLHRSAEDELVNAITHGFGFALSVVGTMMMLAALPTTNTSLALGCKVYLASLVTVYLMSTLSHCALSPKWKTLYRKLDQATIFLLIVGTYTPFSLAYLQGGLWPVVLMAMWTGAFAGFISKMFFEHNIESSSVVPYLILGWVPIFAMPTIWQQAPAGVFISIMAGGLCYMIGTIFLTNDQKVKHFHAIWHLCVIAGSACHFMGVLVFIAQGVA